MEKKDWTEPELIVLVRSKPEEAVLFSCKNETQGAGIHQSDKICTYSGNGCNFCVGATSS